MTAYIVVREQEGQKHILKMTHGRPYFAPVSDAFPVEWPTYFEAARAAQLVGGGATVEEIQK